MKRTLKLAAIMILSLSLLLAGCGQAAEEQPNTTPGGNKEGAEQQEPKGTIVFGVTPWTSTAPPTHIAKQILEEAGYTVELKNADIGIVFTGLEKGDIDIFMDSWLPDMHENYMKKYGKGIEDLAISYPNGELGWVVPNYMEDINTVEDLKGKEDVFDGKVYGIDPGAGMTSTSKELIKDYGLNLEYLAGSEATMMSQVKRFYATEKPVLFLGWRPHSMFAIYDLKVLADPKGFFKTSEVHVLVHKGFKEEFPEAHNIMSKWGIDVGDIEQQILDQEKGEKWEDLASAWIEANRGQVDQMLGK
jgi:glycine betaine/proline transport system substrate-binding protein